jgi:hypothetical protein
MGGCRLATACVATGVVGRTGSQRIGYDHVHVWSTVIAKEPYGSHRDPRCST